ncbi:MAG: hypothetical protein ACW99G_01290 [Candidatus Thorarchaeota archaeon]|jgi:hypothetical protein
MKTFFQWVEDSKLDLPVVIAAPEGEDATNENGFRTGYSANYPDAYVRAHYPDAYAPPKKATAFLDKVAKPKKVKDSAAN